MYHAWKNRSAIPLNCTCACSTLLVTMYMYNLLCIYMCMCRGSEDDSLRASPEHPTSPRLSVGKGQSGEGERESERRERE